MNGMKESEALEILHEKYMDDEYYFAENDCYPKDFDEAYHRAMFIAINTLSDKIKKTEN